MAASDMVVAIAAITAAHEKGRRRERAKREGGTGEATRKRDPCGRGRVLEIEGEGWKIGSGLNLILMGR
jgi:hypothetical protein